MYIHGDSARYVEAVSGGHYFTATVSSTGISTNDYLSIVMEAGNGMPREFQIHRVLSWGSKSQRTYYEFSNGTAVPAIETKGLDGEQLKAVAFEQHQGVAVDGPGTKLVQIGNDNLGEVMMDIDLSKMPLVCKTGGNYKKLEITTNFWAGGGTNGSLTVYGYTPLSSW